MRHDMTTAIAFGLLLAMAACGGQDVSTTESGATPDVSARPAAGAPAAGGAASAPADSAAAAGAATASADAVDCLGLVEQARYAQAIPVCMRALEIEPNDRELRQALTTAKAEAGQMAAAGADAEAQARAAAESTESAARAAAGSAQDAADQAAQDATDAANQAADEAAGRAIDRALQP